MIFSLAAFCPARPSSKAPNAIDASVNFFFASSSCSRLGEDFFCAAGSGCSHEPQVGQGAPSTNERASSPLSPARYFASNAVSSSSNFSTRVRSPSSFFVCVVNWVSRVLRSITSTSNCLAAVKASRFLSFDFNSARVDFKKASSSLRFVFASDWAATCAASSSLASRNSTSRSWMTLPSSKSSSRSVAAFFRAWISASADFCTFLRDTSSISENSP